MHITKQTFWIAFPLIGICLAMIFAGVLLRTGYATETLARTQATTTAKLISDLRDVQSALVDAETGQRGYLLTGQAEYLAPFENGRLMYGQTIERILSMPSAKILVDHSDKLENLQNLVTEKFVEMDRTISLYDNGNQAAALELVRTDFGKALMDDIRRLVTSLVRDEIILQQTAISKAEQVQAQAQRILGFIACLIVFMIIVVFIMFRQVQKLDMTKQLLADVSKHSARTDVLAQELSHRVKNLFGIIASIVRMTGRTETDAQVLTKKIGDRINALSRAHALTTVNDTDQDTNLSQLVEVILTPYAINSRTFSVNGPEVVLVNNTLTPLGLILHEIATNAVKYGSWSTEAGGNIDVSWTTERKNAKTMKVILVWNEHPDQSVQYSDEPDKIISNSSGFGTRMMDMSAVQLGGHVQRHWDGGLRLILTFEIVTSEFESG